MEGEPVGPDEDSGSGARGEQEHLSKSQKGKGVKSRVMKVSMILTHSVSGNTDHPHGDVWKQADTEHRDLGP